MELQAKHPPPYAVVSRVGAKALVGSAPDNKRQVSANEGVSAAESRLVAGLAGGGWLLQDDIATLWTAALEERTRQICT